MSTPSAAMHRSAERAVGAFAVVACCYVVFVVLLAVVDDVPRAAFDTGRPIDELPFMTGSLATAAAGLLLAVKRPHNPVGWLLLLLAFGFSAYPTLVMAGHALAIDAISPLWLRLLAWPGNWVWLSSHAAVIFVLLLFPDGRLPSRRWRPIAWLAVADLIAIWFAVAGYEWLEIAPGVANPLAFGSIGPAVLGRLFTAMLALEALAAVSLVVRYRASRGAVRLQLKWVAFGGVVSILWSLVVPVVTVSGAVAEGTAWLRWSQGVTGLPLLAGVIIAVLRYRLYEIDRIVSRTVTYAVVTAVLIALYAAIAILPAAVLGAPDGGPSATPDLLVAAATLAAAAVFVPVRRRVQVAVDRRFNRARYDAGRVVERFGTRLRDELDVEHLTGDLRRVVGTTVQPAHLSLWLPAREPSR